VEVTPVRTAGSALTDCGSEMWLLTLEILVPFYGVSR
jgi:hypothetical protein